MLNLEDSLGEATIVFKIPDEDYAHDLSAFERAGL